jgi:hypothetical protein
VFFLNGRNVPLRLAVSSGSVVLDNVHSVSNLESGMMVTAGSSVFLHTAIPCSSKYLCRLDRRQLSVGCRVSGVIKQWDRLVAQNSALVRTSNPTIANNGPENCASDQTRCPSRFVRNYRLAVRSPATRVMISTAVSVVSQDNSWTLRRLTKKRPTQERTLSEVTFRHRLIRV